MTLKNLKTKKQYSTYPQIFNNENLSYDNKIDKRVTLKLAPQIITSDIPYDPYNCEAFVYKLTNLNNVNKKNKKKYYIGVHLGKPGDGYLNSSSCDEFKKDFAELNSKWHYEVLQYGNFKYMQAVEHSLLIDANAAKNKEFYNKHNGSSSIDLPRVNEMLAVSEEIRKTKSYKGVTSKLQRVGKIDQYPFFYQVREKTLDADHINRIRDKIKDEGQDYLNRLLRVFLEDRTFEGQTGLLKIGGNHSEEGARKSSAGDQTLIPTLIIPKRIHQYWTDTEVKLLALYLNPREGDPILESSLDDVVVTILSIIQENKIDTSSKEIQDTLKNCNLTSNEKRKVIQIVKEKQGIINPNIHSFINYSVGLDNDKILSVLKKEHNTEENKTGIYTSLKSSGKNEFWQDFYNIQIHNRDNPKNKIKKYVVRLYHISEHYKKRWFQKFARNNLYALRQAFKSIRVSVKFIYLPETRNKLSKGGI